MKSALLIGIITLLLLSVGQAKLMRELTKIEEIYPIVFGIYDKLQIVMYTRDECPKCEQAMEIMDQLIEKYDGIIESNEVDCELLWHEENNQKMLPMCDPKHADRLPIISFMEPPQVKINPVTKQPNTAQDHVYQGEGSLREFEKFAKRYLPVYRTKIQDESQLDDFLENEQLNKVLLFTDKKDTSILYKGITAHFKDRLFFAEVPSSLVALTEKYNVNKFPTLLVLKNIKNSDEPEIITYDKELQFKAIVEFLNLYASQKKITNDPRMRQEPEGGEEEEGAEADSSKDNKNMKDKLKFEELDMEAYKNEIITSEEMPVLIHITENEQDVHPHWEEITKKYGKLFIYYKFVVDDSQKRQFAENELKIRQFPSIKFLPIGTTKKPYSRISFNMGDSLEDINSEIDELITDNTINVNEQSLQIKMQQAIQDNKILLVFFHSDVSISLTYRLLSHLTKYKQKFEFLNMRDPSEKVKQQFQLTKLPRLIAVFRDATEQELAEQVKPEQVKASIYSGKFNFNELSQFLNSWIKEEVTVKNKKKIVKIETQKQLMETCSKKSKSCFLAILNGAEKNQTVNGQSINKLTEQLQILQQARDKFGDRPITFGWIDAICQSTILNYLQMSDSDLPNFIFYSDSKQSYAKVIGRFDYESITIFVHNSLKGTVAMAPLNLTQFNIQKQDCEEIHEKYNQSISGSKPDNSEEEDEILKEILEEERKKREELEKEFKKDKKNKKKQKKQKKPSNTKNNEQTDQQQTDL